MIDEGLVDELRRSFAAALDHDDPMKARHELLAAGWLDALDHDDALATAVVFRLQGSTLRDAAALDDVVTRHVAVRWPDAGGDVAVAYPVCTPPDGSSEASHVVLPARAGARRLLWLSDLDGQELLLIDVQPAWSESAVTGIDPDFGLRRLSEPPPGESTRLAERGVNDWWITALAAGRVAVAHQMIASANALVEMATTYAAARRQFGQPVGSFQAVKHRLAETLVAVASADAVTVAAASSGDPTTAALAKALAGRASLVAAKNCLQVFGGIGFTVEHDFHHHFRRNLVLDRMLGDHRTIEQEIGKQLRRSLLDQHRIINLDVQPRVDLLGVRTLGGTQ